MSIEKCAKWRYSDDGACNSASFAAAADEPPAGKIQAVSFVRLNADGVNIRRIEKTACAQCAKPCRASRRLLALAGWAAPLSRAAGQIGKDGPHRVQRAPLHASCGKFTIRYAPASSDF